jgi:hypothetical protein
MKLSEQPWLKIEIEKIMRHRSRGCYKYRPVLAIPVENQFNLYTAFMSSDVD